MLHPVHGNDEVQQGGEEQVVDPLVRVPFVEPGVRGQVDIDLPEVEVPVPDVRRSSRVRQEKKDKDFIYY